MSSATASSEPICVLTSLRGRVLLGSARQIGQAGPRARLLRMAVAWRLWLSAKDMGADFVTVMATMLSRLTA